MVYWAVLVPYGATYLLDSANSPCLRGTDIGWPRHSRSREDLADAYLVASFNLFADSWAKLFWVINIWGGTVLVVLIEVLCLNNIKRQIVSPPT